MRGRSAALAALSVVGVLLQASPASAEPPAPVTSVSVTTAVNKPAHEHGTFTTKIVVGWTGEDPAASGVRVCVVLGVHPSHDPGACDIKADVAAPGTHTGPLLLATQHTYSVSVFTWTGGTAREYSSGTSVTWHGSALDGKHLYYLTFGQRVTLAATLSDARTRDGLPAAKVSLLHVRPGSHVWKRVTSRTTDTHGKVSASVQPRDKGPYAWAYNGGDGHLATAEPITIYLDYRITAHLTSSHAAPGQTVKMYGIVRPATVGKHILLTEYQSTCQAFVTTGQRVTAKRQTLPNGHTTFGYVMGITRTAGTYRFEAAANQDQQMNGGASAPVALSVGAATARRALPLAPTTAAC